MNYIAPLLLFIESAISFYKYLSPKSFYGSNTLDLILGLIFLILGIIGIKKYKNRVFQWIVLLFSLIMGPGGFIGIGGLTALILAIYFVVVTKRSSIN